MSSKISFRWTLKYTLLNVAYFAAFCTVHAYAAVLLLANGFNNTEVGVLLALSNIVSAVLQPVVAGIIDRPGPLTNQKYILFSVLGILAGAVFLIFIPGNKILIFAVYAVIYMIQLVYQPVLTALCFEYQKAGCGIYYGLARGLGSAGFAVTSMFVGGIVEKSGVQVLLWVTIAVMILSTVVAILFRKPSQSGENVAEDGSSDENSGRKVGDTHIASGASFFHTYPAFSLFLIGAICFFFAHNMINDFMIQIIRNLGGNETELGYSNFLQAILELPVMALIGAVLKKIAANKLLIISGVAFFIKILILVFAVNMSHMYLSQSFQLFAYAVFIPAGAYYVSQTMKEIDQVKGQAFITSAITIGGVFSNLVSGVILDHSSIKVMLLTGSVVCAVGVVVTYIAMTKLPHFVE